MFKKVQSLTVLLLIIFGINLFSQEKAIITSSFTPPQVMNPLPESVRSDFSPLSYNSRAFGYNTYGGPIQNGPCKMWLCMPFGLTSLAYDSLYSSFIAAASFDGSGNWWGIRFSTNELVKIDTITGIITHAGIVTGAPAPYGLAWDFTTSTMYISNNASGNTQIGILNLTTGVANLFGTVSTTGVLIDIACSNSGQIYGHVMQGSSPSQIYSINKSTGTGTPLPQNTGFIANYAQGMSWDHSVDTGYLAAFNNTTLVGELRKIDIATGNTTLVGTIGSEIDGFAIPGFAGPKIIHTPLPYTLNLIGPYVVNAIFNPSGSPVSTGKIFWSRNNPVITDSVTMTHGSGNNWTGNIPGNGSQATYRYYLKAIDQLNRPAYAPPSAPANLYQFLALLNDTSKPIIMHTPIGNTPKSIWPNKVSCNVTEPFGIDSVWVRWYKNSGTYNRFNLMHDTDNVWSASFNSDTSQVTFGDHIYYKIIARSGSAQHKMDSTSLYNFNIVNQVCIGNGTVSLYYPFSTYWDDGRTDMLFLSSEIAGAGGLSSYIYCIGFNLINYDPELIHALKVKMQSTNSSTITGFTNSGWTICYNNNYSLIGTGLQYINLATPFYWLSGQNLLIEVCYNNFSWTNSSNVYSTTIANKCCANSIDLPTGDGCTEILTATIQTSRPNICLIMNPVLNNFGSGISAPFKYDLSQNYPNPCNPTTKINYSIETQEKVILKVYDILGREIKTLVNEMKSPGNYIVEFNGSEFSSGVYFYRIQAGNFNQVKRMVLIK